MMNSDRSLLDQIDTPSQLQKIAVEKLPELATEIRRELLEVVSRNGGHLASNLGMVELTIALLRVFGGEHDHIVWDTGHQSYTYKILTGRRELFRNLRQSDGCCGFLCRQESGFDVFGAGHAGTAISAATGVAVARERQGKAGRVLAVVGDGALGCGVSLEGLNNVIESTQRLIVILNDNKMSISPNVGALSRYLNRIISDQRYNQVKGVVSRMVSRIPAIGGCLHRLIHRIQEGAKGVLVDAGFFEELGFRYIGPLNGHDIDELVATLERLKNLDGQPLLVHVLTEKGHGYKPAEADPATFHGLGRFNPETGLPISPTGDRLSALNSYCDVFGENLGRLMKTNSRIIAITAGMCDGTGLGGVRDDFPERFFDVGIAEEHAVVFAAGMATQGLVPVVAIYASFMQRALDYAFHDVALQNLPVVFCLDRAGVVPDGPTHHGIHDLGFWQSIANIKVMQPADAEEMRGMLQLAVAAASPCVIRYPKCDNAEKFEREHHPGGLEMGHAEVVRQGDDLTLWCLGHEVRTGLEVANLLAAADLQASVVNVRFIRPFDQQLLQRQARMMPVATIEDHCLTGGLASLVNRHLVNLDGVRIINFGWPDDRFVPFGAVDDLRRQFEMDSPAIARRLRAWLASGA